MLVVGGFVVYDDLILWILCSCLVCVVCVGFVTWGLLGFVGSVLGWGVLCGLRLFVMDVITEFWGLFMGAMLICLAFDFRFVRFSRAGLFEFGLPM